ncbi:MAG: hypothetical protein JTJ23_08585, partial [Fusicatenibacter saccharivorans]|nr:hypothetical protein [Fusicatenibacter saccharivorans]
KKFSTAERELLRHRFSSYPGTPSNLFLAIRALQHCLFCIIFGSCYNWVIENAVNASLEGEAGQRFSVNCD